MADFSGKTVQVRRQRRNICEEVKGGKNCHLRILYPVIIPEGRQNKDFFRYTKLKVFVTSRNVKRRPSSRN